MFSAMRSKIYFQVGLWVSVPGQHELCRLLPAKVKTMLIKKLGILSSKCRIYSSLQLFSAENLCFSCSRSGYCGLRLSAGTGSFIVNSNLAGNMVTMIIMMLMTVMMMCQVIEGDGEICHKKRSNGTFFMDLNTSRDYIQVMSRVLPYRVTSKFIFSKTHGAVQINIHL